MKESEDNEIANIYQRVLKGDKAALNNIDKLKNSPVRISSKLPIQPALQISESQRISQDLTKASKSQNFRKYLRQKVSQFGTANPQPKKQNTKNQKQHQNKQFAEPKPFPKVRKRSQIKSQQKNTQAQNIKKIQKSTLPQKTKTTSNNFQQNIQKNIIKDSITQKDKHSTPPSSKHSFRIRIPGGNKKLLQQLMKINEQQKRLQSQILHLHKQNKDHIAEICKKYKINILQNIKTQDMQNLQIESIDSPSITILKSKSQHISSQQAKITKLKKQINTLNKQIENKKTQINKKQAKIQVLPLNVYMKSIPDIFQQRQSQQQENQVNQLPSNDKDNNMDPTKTYQSVMSSMRKKKWGLQRRINYQSQSSRPNDSKVQLQKSPPKSQHFSPAKVQPQGQLDNKIIINSRLKQFLFE